MIGATCEVDEEDLWDLVDAGPSGSADPRLLQHVEQCSSCQERLKEIRRLHSGLEAVGRQRAPSLPETIGPCRIIRLIGEGGMGVVYEARQDDLERHVAVKVMRPTASASHRRLHYFRREIQVLGRLRHPCIGRIYDVGCADDGQQYFVMELVEGGRSLLDYCRELDLSVRDRLALFVQVINAISHAHQRGVIHRDIKPGNILVDEEGTPRVLDFGLARFTEHQAEVTTASLAGSPSGTLPYMSPEQTCDDPEDLDVRTDVYSLGVVLYELLTGCYPYDVTGPVTEVLRNIVEAEPARPRDLNGEITHELETIVLKTLGKDKDRRYASAAGLAEDIGHYLAGEAITACPPTLGYRLRVLVRRNRILMGASAAVLLVLVSAAVVSTTWYLRAESARAETATERDQGRQVIEFLTGMLLSVDPTVASDDVVSLRAVLDTAAQQVDEGVFGDEPEIEMRLRFLLAQVYDRLGYDASAVPHAARALELRRAVYGAEHPAVAEALDQLALARYHGAEFAPDETEAMFREAWAMRRHLLGDRHPDTLDSMHHLACWLRDAVDAEAETLFREVLRLRRQALGEDHPDVARTLLDLAHWVTWCGSWEECPEQHAEAEAMTHQALGILLLAHGNNHLEVAEARQMLGSMLLGKGDAAGAERELRDALRVRREMLRSGHPSMWGPLANLGRAALAMGKHEEAESLLRESLEIYLATSGGEEGRSSAGVRSALGLCLARAGCYEQAEEQLLAAHRILDRLEAEREAADKLAATRRIIELYSDWDRPDMADQWRSMLPDGASPDELDG
ncbi:MAG: serine/threonine protein kinase [Planctomycetota bacterium]